MVRDNSGAEKVAQSSRLFLVPCMGHCGGGPAQNEAPMPGPIKSCGIPSVTLRVTQKPEFIAFG